VERFLEIIGGLVEQGDMVVVIEHILDVIKAARRIIDLGPEGGEKAARWWRRERLRRPPMCTSHTRAASWRTS
jgi:hypothetical protein